MSGMRALAREADEAARVRRGARADTPGHELHDLARDPAVTVRAAVAMNGGAPAEVNALLARDADERVRAVLARKLAQLVPGLTGRDRSQLEQQAYDTLVALVQDEAVRVRAAIAEVVRDMPEAPRALILRLARDAAVPVSDPVLRLSPLLTPEDLLALIADPPSPATAVSIASRANLAPDVSDAIARTANNAAIAALLANRSAAIREATLDALIARAVEHADWHEPLVRRPVLPARAARMLAQIVAGHLLRVLAKRRDLDPAVLRDIGQRLEAKLAAGQRPTANATDMTIDQAVEAAEALAAQGGISEAAVLEAVQRGESRLAAAMLARAAGVALDVVDRAAALRSAKGIVSLAWQAGFGMRVAVPLQALLARLPPAAILAAGPDEGFPLAVDEMRWQVDFLSRMER